MNSSVRTTPGRRLVALATATLLTTPALVVTVLAGPGLGSPCTISAEAAERLGPAACAAGIEQTASPVSACPVSADAAERRTARHGDPCRV